MSVRHRIEAAMRPLVIVLSSLCAVGALAAILVILIRVPPMASTKIDMVFGTLQGAAVALLFTITALLINLTSMVYRATQPTLPIAGDDPNSAERSGPIE